MPSYIAMPREIFAKIMKVDSHFYYSMHRVNKHYARLCREYVIIVRWDLKGSDGVLTRSAYCGSVFNTATTIDDLAGVAAVFQLPRTVIRREERGTLRLSLVKRNGVCKIIKEYKYESRTYTTFNGVICQLKFTHDLLTAFHMRAYTSWLYSNMALSK